MPTALFLFIPVFALLLKVFYLGSGRRYLEHLVVALYSHAWLLLVLMGTVPADGRQGRPSPRPGSSVVTGAVSALLWLWMPIYLFLMQRRVYGEHWAITLIRYWSSAPIYVLLVLFVVTVWPSWPGSCRERGLRRAAWSTRSTSTWTPPSAATTWPGWTATSRKSAPCRASPARAVSKSPSRRPHPGRASLCVQYRLVDQAALDVYLRDHAPRLRAEGHGPVWRALSRLAPGARGAPLKSGKPAVKA